MASDLEEQQEWFKLGEKHENYKWQAGQSISVMQVTSQCKINAYQFFLNMKSLHSVLCGWTKNKQLLQPGGLTYYSWFEDNSSQKQFLNMALRGL